MNIRYFTICSNNYLARAITLGKSLRRHNPERDFTIVLADRRYEEIHYSDFCPFEIVDCEILREDIDAVAQRHNIVEFNTLLKPFSFRRFLNEEGVDACVYLDPDIFVDDDLSTIEEMFSKADVLLTPHLLDAPPSDTPYEGLALKVGIFNLGFLGLRRTPGVELLLEWWGSRLEKFCDSDYEKGLFVDQIWANYFPIFFDKVHVIRHYGCNLGYWNFEERVMSQEGPRRLVNGQPLLFIHISSYDPLTPNVLASKLNYGFERRPDLRAVYDEYRDELLKNGFGVFSRLSPKLPLRKRRMFMWAKWVRDQVRARLVR